MAPDAPTALMVVVQSGPLSALLTWHDNTIKETGFVIERSTKGRAFVVLATPGPFFGTGTMTYLDATVLPGETYTYRTKAVNGTVSSAYSNRTCIKVPTLSAAPRRLTGAGHKN